MCSESCKHGSEGGAGCSSDGRLRTHPTKGLETCRHVGPSTIDHRTLQRSGPLPLAFLRDVGLTDTLIDYLPSLLN